MRLPHVTVLALVVVAFLVGSDLSAQDVEAPVMSAAGGTGRAGTLVLVSTVGQPSPVGTAQGDGFSVRSGFVPAPSEGNANLAIQHTVPAVHERGEDLQLVAGVATSGSPVVELEYRRGGDPSDTTVTMTREGDQYVAVIPGESVTERGLVYQIRVLNARGEVLARAPVLGVYSVRVRVSEPGLVRSVPGGTEASSYRLVSVPLVLEDPEPSSVLGDDFGEYDDSEWRFFELPFDQTLNELPHTGAFRPGKAFWLIVRDEGQSFDTGSGTTVPLDRPFRIALHPRWNLIANPFGFPVPVGQLRMESGQSFEMRAFEGAWNDPVSAGVTVLEPLTGYAVFNDRQTVDSLVVAPFPPDTASQVVASKSSTSEPAWAIRILAQHDRGSRDIDNVAGVRSEAVNGPDAFDLPEPPGVGAYVSVRFPHPEWGRLSEHYATDFRAPFAGGERWPLEVTSNVGGSARLTFVGVEHVPEVYEVMLVDEALGVTRDLRQDGSYEIPLAEGSVRSLTLVVGESGFVDDQRDKTAAVPDGYEDPRNFPNPFATSTAIHYGLPREERVTLEIYTVLGTKVNTLVSEDVQSAGRHVLWWDGTDAGGRPVSSGVYLLRFRAGPYVATRSITVVH